MTTFASPAAAPRRSDHHPGAVQVSGGRIVLRGITARGHHGVHAAERRDGQRFAVDLVCEVDLAAAAASDDLAETVDYADLTARVAADVAGPPLDLLEALALRVGRTCLSHPLVRTVEVTVHKPDVVLPAPVGDVAVTLTVHRAPEGPEDPHE